MRYCTRMSQKIRPVLGFSWQGTKKKMVLTPPPIHQKCRHETLCTSYVYQKQICFICFQGVISHIHDGKFVTFFLLFFSQCNSAVLHEVFMLISCLNQQELQRQKGHTEEDDTEEDGTDSFGLQMLFADTDDQPSSPCSHLPEVFPPVLLIGDEQIHNKVQQG